MWKPRAKMFVAVSGAEQNTGENSLGEREWRRWKGTPWAWGIISWKKLSSERHHIIASEFILKLSKGSGRLQIYTTFLKNVMFTFHFYPKFWWYWEGHPVSQSTNCIPLLFTFLKASSSLWCNRFLIGVIVIFHCQSLWLSLSTLFFTHLGNPQR